MFDIEKMDLPELDLLRWSIENELRRRRIVEVRKAAHGNLTKVVEYELSRLTSELRANRAVFIDDVLDRLEYLLGI